MAKVPRACGPGPKECPQYGFGIQVGAGKGQDTALTSARCRSRWSKWRYYTCLEARLAQFNRKVPSGWSITWSALASRWLSQFGNPGADIRRLRPFITSHPGPKARKEAGRNRVLRAGCEKWLLLWSPNGVWGRGPGDFLGTFVSLQKYLARGRNVLSSKLPSRPQAKSTDKLKFTRTALTFISR